MEYALLPFRRYFDFKGRSRRKEYWLFTLLIALASLVIAALESATGLVAAFGENGLLSIIFSLGTFIPGIAVLVRRLHDTDRSGWWLLAILVPFFVLGFAFAGGVADTSSGAGLGGLGIGVIVGVLATFGVIITLFVFTVLDGTLGRTGSGLTRKIPQGT